MSDQPAYTGSETLTALESAENYNAAIESLFSSMPGIRGRVLDIGAGTGEFARRLRSLGATVTCVEPDPTLRARLEQAGFTCFPDIAAAPVGFDAVTMINVLEHIEDDRGAMRDVRDRLIPGGRVFVFVPALQFLYSRFDRAIGHHRRYAKKQLRDVVGASLTIETLRWFDSLGIPTAFVFRLTRKATPSAGSVRLYDRFLFPVSRLVDRVTQRAAGKNLYCVAQKV